MSIITTLPDRLCEWFSDMTDFADCTFCTHFPKSAKSTPLNTPVIVFGVGDIKVLENTADETGEVITNRRVCDEKFTVNIHVPRTDGGTKCNSILDKIIDMLLFNSPLAISTIQSDEPKYIRNTDSIVLKSSFTLSDTLERGAIYPPQLKLT